MGATRRKNEVWDFATWWFDFVGRDVSSDSGDFRAVLGMAKNLKKGGCSLSLVKRALVTMREHGVVPSTPYAVRWKSPERDKDWYNYSRPELPPVWDHVSRELHQSGSVPIRF